MEFRHARAAIVAVTALAALPATAQEIGPEPAPRTLVAATQVNEVALRPDHVLVDLTDAMAAGIRGMRVISADDVEVGEIDRLMPRTASVRMGLGGFWGLGERPAVLPLTDMSFQRRPDGTISAFIPQSSDRLGEIPAEAGSGLS